jgi:hypothetical protein
MKAIGRKTWVIAEGYIPPDSTSTKPDLISHEAACIVNTGDVDAHVSLTLYFTDRNPAGPYELLVPARRTRHFRFNDLDDPEPVPRGADYSTLIESDVPVVVQHTRLDSRKSELALMTTVAYADG